MSFTDIKTRFLDLSGRADLTDADVSFYVNAGQRKLDAAVGFTKSLARAPIAISAGQSFVSVEGCRAVTEVWASNGTGRTRLEKKSLAELRTSYPDPFAGASAPRFTATEEVGTPLYYAVAVDQQAPVGNELRTEAETTDRDGLIEGNSYDLKTIHIAPPPDAAMTISIVGEFYSPKLLEAGDASYWSEEHPDLLLLSALYTLENFYRNTEGAKDYLNALTVGLRDVDVTLAAEEVAEINVMEG